MGTDYVNDPKGRAVLMKAATKFSDDNRHELRIKCIVPGSGNYDVFGNGNGPISKNNLALK